MTTILVSVLKISLGASIIALAVMLVRLFLRNKPKFYSYALWAAVLLRLLCPFSLEIEADIPTYNDIFINIESSAEEFVRGQENAILSEDNNVDLPAAQPPFATPDVGENGSYQENIGSDSGEVAAEQITAFTWLHALGLVWLLGIAAVLTSAAYSYITLSRQIRCAARIKENIFISDRIASAFVLGLAAPRIYLPRGLNAQNRDIILLHEKTHISRGDHIVKLFSYILLAFHWFNPILWLSYSLMCADMEKSCDEAVLKKLGEKNELAKAKKSYGKALLAVAKSENALTLVAFSEGNIRERIKSMLNCKFEKLGKKTLISIAGLITAVVLVFGITMIGCKAPSDTDIGVDRGNTTGNIVLSDVLDTSDVVGGKWIYSVVHGSFLGRTSTDGKKYELLNDFEDRRIEYLNYGGDVLYYVKSSSYNNFICEFDIESREERIIFDSVKEKQSGNPQYLSLVNGKLYFVSHQTLFELDPKTAEYSEIYSHNSPTKDWNIFDEYSYFVSVDEENGKDSICRVEHKSGDMSAVIVCDSTILTCIVDNGCIYYDTNGRHGSLLLCCYDPQNGSINILTKSDDVQGVLTNLGYLSQPWYWNIYDGCLYLNEEEASFVQRNPDFATLGIKAVFLPERGSTISSVFGEQLIYHDKANNCRIYNIESGKSHELFYSQIFGLEEYNTFCFIEITDCLGNIVSDSVEQGEDGNILRVPDGVTNVSYPGISVSQLIIPDSVERIDHGAFSEQENLRHIDFGNGLKYILSSSFSRCYSLEEIVLPASLEVIYYNAFAWCTSLRSVTFLGDIESIQIFGDAFEYCPDDITFYNSDGEEIDISGYIIYN